MEPQRDNCSSRTNGIMSYTEFLQSKHDENPIQSPSGTERHYNTTKDFQFNDNLVSNLKTELMKAANIIKRVKGEDNYTSMAQSKRMDNSALIDLRNENERQKRVIEEMNINNDIINQQQQKELQNSQLIIQEKSKNLTELVETLKKEILMNKELQRNCEKYEMMVESMLLEKEKQNQLNPQCQVKSQKEANDSELIAENNKLKQEIKKKDQIIKEVIEEMNEKEKIFKEITNMKEEVIEYATKLEKMTQEMNIKDEIIKKLQSRQSNDNDNDYKAKYEFEIKRNEKMVKKFEELSNSMSFLEQSDEALTKKYKSLAMDFNGEHVNKDILKENKELKKMNQDLISKMEGLPELEKKFKELFDEIIELKMENDYLKKERGHIKSSNESNTNHPDNDNDNEVQQQQNKIGNEEEEEFVMKDLNLYSLYQSSLLCFNLSGKKYTIVNPKGMKSLFELYQPKGSLFFNTLQGLFILTGEKYNELFYYSQKSSNINKILSFNDNHQYGALILNEETKQIVVLSGSQTDSVEKLHIEQGKISYLPSMTQKRMNASCCYINRILYVFFGFSPEQNKCISTIEYIDINSTKKDNKWQIANVISKENYEFMNHSVLGLTDKQVLIFGGVDGNKKMNTNILFYDNESNICEKIPITSKNEQLNPPSLFSVNPLFKDYCYGNSLAFANLDDSFNVHLFNASLEHEVIIFNPNLIQS